MCSYIIGPLAPVPVGPRATSNTSVAVAPLSEHAAGVGRGFRRVDSLGVGWHAVQAKAIDLDAGWNVLPFDEARRVERGDSGRRRGNGHGSLGSGHRPEEKGET